MPTREHLFKAKRKDNGEWVKGFFSMMTKGAYLNPIENGCYITTFEKLKNGEIILSKIFEVIPETVCECTGLTDKNGDEIFEGDIVKAFLNNETLMICSIIFRAGCFWYGNWNFVEFLGKFRNVEAISNIYDNPELLEVKV